MKIVITNDDSIFSDGIRALEEELKKLGEVFVVAPDREKSAVSFGITTNEPLRIIEIDKNHYAVTGTPVDCVYLAVKVILDEKPDLLISGINHGANLGEDTIYSGTVAGAFQASLLGIRAFAVSSIENSEGDYDLESAVRISLEFAKYLLNQPPVEGKIFSINVPYSPKGVRFAKLGHKRYEAEIKEILDPRGNKFYWIGPGKILTFGESDSDVKLIESGYASVVPLYLNFSDGDEFKRLKGKENEIFKEMV